MIVKKKLFGALMLSAALLTACGSSHTHAPEGEWVCDAENHWKLCSCGEIVEKAAHTVEDEHCSVCGSDIMVYEDGSSTLFVYDVHDNCIQFISYAADGSVEWEERNAYEYDADGNLKTADGYQGDLHTFHNEYAVSSDGMHYLAVSVCHNEDGTKTESVYDAHGNTLKELWYAADGSVESETRTVYSDDYSHMTYSEYTGGVLTCEQEYRVLEEENVLVRDWYSNEDGSAYAQEYDEYSNTVAEITYAADGSVEREVRYENEYDAEGNMTLQRTYEDGVLTVEMEYLSGSDEEGSWSMSGKVTYYYEDGTKMVADSDPEQTWSTETTYAADGSVLNEIRYEYLRDEEGNDIGSMGYENGRLFLEYHSILDENGETVGLIRTKYHEDGTKTVYEYNAELDLVGETAYDAAGNPVED